MNKDKATPKQIILTLVSIMGIILLVGLAIFVINGGLNYANKPKVVKITKRDSGLTPQQTVQKFVLNAGNMGAINQINYNDLRNNSVLLNMEANRVQALEKSINYISSNSPYMDNYSKESIVYYASNISQPIFYSVPNDSLLIGPSKPAGDISIYELNGKSIKYKSVNVTASFTSTVYSLMQTGSDTSWNGSYRLSSNKKTFTNVKFTLINQN